jgi:hypothetical protein
MSEQRAVLVLVLALVVVAGCGIPRDSAPRPIAAADVQFNLLGASTTAPPATNSGAVTGNLYFISGDRLHKVERQVQNSTPDAVIDALLAGVAPEDGSVRSAIPPGTQRVSTRFEDKVLIIELTPEILGQQGQEQKNAFAQLVFTASDIESVFGVRFVVGGQFVNVPTDSGASDQAIYPVDFDSVRPES